MEGNAGEIGIDSDTTGLNNVVENRTSLVNADVEQSVGGLGPRVTEGRGGRGVCLYNETKTTGLDLI